MTICHSDFDPSFAANEFVDEVAGGGHEEEAKTTEEYAMAEEAEKEEVAGGGHEQLD